MREDIKLEEFVKSGLEDGVTSEPPRMAEILHAATEAASVREAWRKSHRRLWGASLVAASVALVCSYAIFHAQTEASSPENTVVCVIDLLRAADGAGSATDEPASVAEMLLAWQDAPYEAAISDLVAAE